VAQATAGREPPAGWGTPRAAGGRRLARRLPRHQPASARAQTAPLRERPTEKKGRTRRPAPRAPTRLLRAHRRAHLPRTDAHTSRAPTRLHDAHRPRTCDARDTFVWRADARIRRTQCALTRCETRVTTLTFFVGPKPCSRLGIFCVQSQKQNQRLTSGSAPAYYWERECSSLLSADQYTDAYLSLYFFHAKHVRECKLPEEQNPRLTHISLPVYQFIICETKLFRCCLPTNVPKPCLCKPFSCKACLGNS
jgi:hypothetical protein